MSRFESPDGGAGESGPLGPTVRPLSEIRPDLVEGSRPPKGGGAGMDAYLNTLGNDPGGPDESPDPEPEPKPKAAPKAAAKTGKDRESPGTGKDHESAGEEREAAAGAEDAEVVDDDSVLQTILDKFTGQPESPSRRIRKSLNGQSEDAELKAALERIEELEEVSDRLLVRGEQGWDVRPEHAGRALAEQRGRGIPTEAQVRKAIEERLAKSLADEVDEESIPAVIKAQKAMIDEQVAAVLQQARTQVQMRETQEQIHVGKVLQDHLTKHPKDKDLLASLDKFVARMPDELKGRMVAEGWIDVPKVFHLLRTDRDMRDALKEAYDAGKKAGGAPKLSVTGERGTAGGSPRRGKAGSFDQGEFKKGLHNPEVQIAGVEGRFTSFERLMSGNRK